MSARCDAGRARQLVWARMSPADPAACHPNKSNVSAVQAQRAGDLSKTAQLLRGLEHMPAPPLHPLGLQQSGEPRCPAVGTGDKCVGCDALRGGFCLEEPDWDRRRGCPYRLALSMPWAGAMSPQLGGCPFNTDMCVWPSSGASLPEDGG